MLQSRIGGHAILTVPRGARRALYVVITISCGEVFNLSKGSKSVIESKTSK
jgi:hypothetical protein